MWSNLYGFRQTCSKEIAKGLHVLPGPLQEVRPLIPYPTAARDKWLEGEPYACDDLLQRDGWYPHEFHLAESGIRSYASVPLIARGEVIGVAAFTRIEQRAFPADALTILRDVGRALSIAAANAMNAW